MDSVLSRATSGDVVRSPFPHLWVRDAVDGALADRLIEEFPPLDRVAAGNSRENNKRFDLVHITLGTGPEAAGGEKFGAAIE